MASYISRYLKRFIPFLFLLFSATRTMAAVEPYQNRIHGALKKGDVLTVKDEKFQNSNFNWSLIKNRAVDNIITFGLYRDSVLSVKKSFSCEIELQVEYWSQPDQKKPVTIDNIKLKINYDTAYGAVYQADDTYHFKNAHRYKITVKNISSSELGEQLPPIFSLQAQIFVDRKYLPSENEVIPELQITSSGAQQEGMVSARGMGTMDAGPEQTEIGVHWGEVMSAEEYDLEWTFVDEESDNGRLITAASGVPTVAQLEAFMRNNATRVTIAEHDYRISLVHNSKYLLVRWRTVSYDDEDEFRREGAWNYNLQIGGAAATGVITLTTEWHHPGFNWQYSASYAEEGKRDEKVVYYDGVLRNRQSVSIATPDRLDANSNYAIVTQNIYDQFGRTAANVLPAPVPETALRFYGNVNNKSEGSYRYSDLYNGGFGSCLVAPLPMSSISGAAKYFSSENNLPSVNKDYIPSSGGYPFNMLSYTPDNTGKIAMHGGVGVTLQPTADAATDHVTRFFYSRPYSGELERLFGSDVGQASRYLKKVSIDPNKQINISYEDASGHVIATALAGTPPTNVDALESSGLGGLRTSLVLSPDNILFDRQDLKLRGYSTFMNTVTGPAKINYEIDKLIKQYEENGVSICSNCHYAMRMKLTDDCGTVLLQVDEPIKIGSVTPDCAAGGKQTAELDFNFARIGTHFITFELAMDPNVIKSYTEDYIARNTNLRTKFNFVLDALKLTDFTGCFTECTTCEANLGTRDHFQEQLGIQLKKYDIDPYKMGADYENWADGLYNVLLTQCKQAQANCMETPCSALKDQMLADVSPGGQYSLFANQNGTFVVLEPSTNIINLHWREWFRIEEPNSVGYNQFRIQLEDGRITSASDESFTVEMLVKYWKPEWAEYFLSYHPEYCALTACQNTALYTGWDNLVKDVYTTASDIGRIRAGLAYERDNPAWLVNADPFFAQYNAGFQYQSAFIEDLKKYSVNVSKFLQPDLGVKNIVQYVDYQLYCADTRGNMTPVSDDTWNTCTPSAACRVPDREWQAYRDLYMQAKQKYIDKYRDQLCPGMCPVGQPSFSFDCPRPDQFILKDEGTAGCATGKKKILVELQGGVISNEATLTFSYSSPHDVAGNPVTLVMTTKTAEFCVNENLPLSAIGIESVNCVAGGGDVFCSQLTTADIYHLPTRGSSQPIWSNSYTYIGPEIPENYIIWVHLQDNPDIPFETNSITFTRESPKTVVIQSQYVLSLYEAPTCGPYSPGTCPPVYLKKESRISRPLAIPSSIGQAQSQANARLAAELKSVCKAQSDTWLARLDECLNSNPGYLTKRELLRTKLIELCALGGDIDHPNGASTLPAGRATAMNKTTFAEVIKEVLGITTFNMVCNPWLLESPYPYNVTPQLTDRELSATSPEFCNKLAALQTEHMNSSPGITFFQYLSAKYGQQLKLTAAEVAMLEKSCGNCRFLLEKPMVMPVFMDPNSAGCIKASVFNQAWTDMMAVVTDASHDNFPTIAANYLNHRWGFTLGYNDYKLFHDKVQGQNNSTEILCNVTVYETVDIDPYACIKDQMDGAVKGALRNYATYIEEVKEQFRSAYVTYCANKPAKVAVKANDNTYHYTLYYYDLAGNRVRTIPPEGVQILSDEQVAEVIKSQTIPNGPCNYNGPTEEADHTSLFQNLAETISLPNSSIEFWLKGDFSATKQILLNADKRYLTNVCIDGRFIYIDVYTTHKLANGVIGFSRSNHSVADMGVALPLREWMHLVVQGGLGSGKMEVYINGKLCAEATNAPKSTCGWQVDINDTVEQLPEELSYVKQIRMYNRKLTIDEIKANAVEVCMGISPAYADILMPPVNAPLKKWGLLNIIPGSGGQGGQGSTIERQGELIYPAHRMATSYSFTSLNSIAIRKTPDEGLTKNWYDKKGRLFASQNAEQLTPSVSGRSANRYTYIKTDDQDRIVEMGEKIGYGSPLGEAGFIKRGEVNSFLSNTGNVEITRKVYDNAYAGANLPQNNVRSRVSAATYQETNAGPVTQASVYSYDQLGNVNTFWQKIDGLESTESPFRRVDYKYDMASGRVSKVRYAPMLNNTAQHFYYKFEYDGENRIKSAQSGISAVGVTGWDIANAKTDASYQYYPHDQLARMELGNDKVQGVDLAYTLQGWIKGVNSIHLDHDMGADGQAGGATSSIMPDIIGYSLDYYNGDYSPIGTNLALNLHWNEISTTTAGADMFNGNISRSTLAIRGINGDAAVGSIYRYDQLNRLVQSREHALNSTMPTWKASTANNNYGENITYDANGNILDYVRGKNEGVAMDDLHYNYDRQNGFLNSNRLDHINDAVPTSTFVDGIKDLQSQSPGYYVYDKIGNLIKEGSGSDAMTVDWTLGGKIKSIRKGTSSITYGYDVYGNRVSKTAVKNGVTTITWYVRDAQGNVLSVYEKEASNGIFWKEQHLYGAKRVGIWTPDLNTNSVNIESAWNSAGNRVYELTNHLGNVLASVSDTRLIKSSSDYYPFGMPKPGRTTSFKDYRYGFNGKENDNGARTWTDEDGVEHDIDGGVQDYGMRIYDGRIGRFLSVDPISSKYPELTPYQFASNRPVDGVDMDGLEHRYYMFVYLNGQPQLQLVYQEDIEVDNFWGGKINLNNTMPGNDYVWGTGHQWKVIPDKFKNKSFTYWDTYSFPSDEKVQAYLNFLGKIGEDAAMGVFVGEIAGGVKQLASWVKGSRASRAARLAEEIAEDIPAIVRVKKCFVAGTKIMTNNGLKDIELLEVGDSVWSYNTFTGKQSLNVIESLSQNTVKRLIGVEVANEFLWTTVEHPFWTDSSWISAANLNAGDSLLLFSGKQSAISKIEVKDSIATVYNFSVSNDHTYFVSSAGVLVHNDCGQGWIAKSLYKQLGRTNPEVRKIFEDLLNLGRKARAEGQSGIKFLAKGKEVGGATYYYELKTPIKSKYGSYRLYGNLEKFTYKVMKDGKEVLETIELVVFREVRSSH